MATADNDKKNLEALDALEGVLDALEKQEALPLEAAQHISAGADGEIGCMIARVLGAAVCGDREIPYNEAVRLIRTRHAMIDRGTPPGIFSIRIDPQGRDGRR